ncbi:PAS domain S-box protein [Nostoc sp. FACHB-110]|uniref:PAS domain S-box protein n=1 Tax=Nostoc sp. FACHB-110 TaxID=2692834 RepID=UPI001688891B|nr:PAS domain S-box protein [Nostoc sp. FACHB-110]MBD2440362.1 PAS domain S-box protein [Nostoc sp. FACHB-110]
MNLSKTREELIIEVEELQQEITALKQLRHSQIWVSESNILNSPSTRSNSLFDKTKEYTVVVIEDSEVDRSIYRRYLSHNSQGQYRIIEFDKGKDALAWCQKSMPDILLIDFGLPDIDGLEFLQQLYQQTKLRWIPAIIITGHENTKLAVELLKNGAQDYLAKNQITPISLQQAIAKVLRQKKLLEEQKWQQQQRQLVTETALSIRNSLKIDEILNTAVTQVREILQSERVIIYKFQPDWSGSVVKESVSNPELSILGQIIQDKCFDDTLVDLYRQGRIRVINDIEKDVNLTQCHRDFLGHLQIRANLIIPIIENDNLWGLLIAHQCHRAREWTLAECELMNQIAIHLEIAIHQATLFEKLQAQLIKNQKLVSIVENSSDFMAMANLDGQVQYINLAGRNLIGLKETQVQQTSIWEYQTPEDNQRFEQQVIPTVTSTGKWEGEFQMRNFQTSELIPVWCNIFTLKEPITGQAQGIAAVVRDIRERKQAQESLQQLNKELELRVVERTAQLVLSNNQLQQELFKREKVEKKLRQSEQLLDGFFQAASQVNIGLSILDKNLCYLKINQGLANINGYPMAAHLGNSILDLLPELVSTLLPLLQNVIETQQPISQMEVSGIVPSQPEVVGYWLVSYFPIVGENSESIAVGSVVLDVSESKRLEIEKEKQIAILEATTDIIVTARLDTQKPEYLNKTARIFFGIKDRESEKIPISDVHPQWALKLIQEQAIPQAIKHGNWLGETAFIRRDGQEVPVSQLIIAHTFGSQQVQAISTIARDITEQKRIESELKESERRWRFLQDNVQLIVVCLDDQGQVDYANPFFLKLTGYVQAEVLGKNWFENFLPLNQQSLIDIYLQELIAQTLPEHYQNEIITKSGEFRLINWNNTILQDVNGNPIGSISIGQDITESHKLERMKAEFISTVSHELRTPLTSMQAALSLLHEKIIDPISPEGEATIEIANTGVDRLVRLVNDILDLERLESGKIYLQKSLCNLSDLINIAVAQMQSIANQAQIYIDTTGVSLVEVIADSDRILQVVINLLSNAIKFSEISSTIWINLDVEKPCFSKRLICPLNSSPCDVIDVTGDNCSSLVFSIKDSGRGIPSEYLDSIFEPFSQVDATDSRTKGGTGLGLSICRKIIQQHGGNIWAESVFGQGSTFYFILPLGGNIGE